MKRTADWKQILGGELKEYRSIPFWSWNNYLDEGELCRQIEEMKSAGIRWVHQHAADGVKRNISAKSGSRVSARA